MSSTSLPQSILQDRRLYEVLGIENFSSGEEVRVAYKVLALKNHPDKNIGDPSAAERFREISRSYEVLANPEHKKVYDVALHLALSSYNRNGGSGYLGSNPYSVNPMSTSEILRELYKRQTERAATRTHTASAGARDQQKSRSQYTKAQQELFRKRERERQQELRKQLEKERKEQRERERAALRREQEKQGELLQQRWQQQQRGFVSRGSTSVTGSKRASSAAAGGGADGSSGAATPRLTRATSRTPTGVAASADGGRSGRRAQAAPNTVRVGTPARSGTPRLPRAGASSPSPGRRSNDEFEATTPIVPTPTSTTKDEDDDGRGTGHGGDGGDRGWYTPLTTPTEDNVRVLCSSAVNSSSDSKEEGTARAGGAASPCCPPSKSSMDFPAGEHGTTSTAAETSSMQHGPQRLFAAATNPPSSAAEGNGSGTGVSKETRASGRKASTPTYSSHRRPLSAAPTATGAATARRHSPGASNLAGATPHSTSRSSKTTPRRCVTPRGVASSYHTRTISPLSTTPRATLATGGSPAGSSSSATRAGAATNVTAARTSSPLLRSNTNSSISSSLFLNRWRVNPGLAESDKELLEKQRRERIAKEKERQRAVRLAEEERQFKRAVYAMKQQRAARYAAEAEEVQLTEAELLRYVQADEMSERQQFIEREEQLAWRRIQRQHLPVLAEAVFKKKFAALTMEERARRNCIGSEAQAGGLLLGCLFQEVRVRCSVEWREWRDRRQLKGREAADAYHVQRLLQRRSTLLTEEANQRRSLVDAASGALAVLRFHLAGDYRRLLVLLEEQAARQGLLEDLTTATGRLEGLIKMQREEVGAGEEQWRQRQHPLMPRDEWTAEEGDSWHTPRTSAECSGYGDTTSMGHCNFETRNATVVTVVPLKNGSSSLQSGPSGSIHTIRSESSSSAATGALREPSAVSTHSPEGSSGTNGERRPPAGATATATATQSAERCLQLLVVKETRQRSLLMRQQHYEEIALRRRRATALHRLFAREKEETVRQAQRAALVELRRLQQQARAASVSSTPRQNGSSSPVSSPRTTGPPPPPILSPSTSLPSQRDSASADATPTRPAMAGPPTSAAAPAVMNTTAATARRSVASVAGWKALPDSDVEDND
ncbi:putative chaperone DNAJ protein [Leptomonas seymouri]|uniref:Putative chaperone DNAJ protein n=1 Tax=Leptomonas seymouri TaxID=5684 RepID=A0A0N0P677_LEPSE|nr:putative chaperone DNAJ protein [Leptomonas seymouri]|eukprot:KPI86847.1 putative chaperone DNAJ protein [Leptomonas seymouri]